MEEQEARELEQRYQKLESKKTLLMRLDETIPWSEFRPLLVEVGVNKTTIMQLKLYPYKST